MKKKMKGFTLIELIAVLVIMAILALIVTPLVMSIIKKAKTSADKRSIDAYGRSIELAIAGYLLDNGAFPTSIEQLTIEYSGEEVVCSTTQLNSNSSVYLAGCTVGGRSVDYTYGKEETAPAPTYTAYSIGDHVSYNGVTYYVIEDSDESNDTVKLLKEEPLTYAEMNALNLTGITISESNGYGLVQYGSSTDYSQSTVKQIVDAWKNSAVASGDAVTARLITKEEVPIEERQYDSCGHGCWMTGNFVIYDWMYGNEYCYYTMTSNSSYSVLVILNDAKMTGGSLDVIFATVRPVLELNKSADISIIN